MTRLIALTQGDPAGIGPEIVLKVIAGWRPDAPWRPLVVAERAALEAMRTRVAAVPWERLVYFDASHGIPDPSRLVQLEDTIAIVDPVSREREVKPGSPSSADAVGALAAIDLGLDLTRDGVADALVTAPVSKEEIARCAAPEFRGHTDHLASRLGDLRYGRDYLMAFLTKDLRVALLSVHVSLREAIAALTQERLLAALSCLDRHRRALGTGDGPIAVAGLNPHAGEGGLLGHEEVEILAPAVAEARRRGLDVLGPASADTLFERARRGEADWVLALYHDQGLIAVKTASFGSATNLTLGLPILRTSVDHGTAYAIAGRGEADASPLRRVIETTVELLRLREGCQEATE